MKAVKTQRFHGQQVSKNTSGRKAKTPINSIFTTDRLLFTPEEVQRELCVGRATIYRLLKSGAIESFRLGKLIRIRRSTLEKLAGIGCGKVVAHG